MIRILREILYKKKVGSFYFNKEDNCKHNTGFVISFNDEEFLVAHINARGEYDGFILNRLEDLYRVEYGGDYEEKILNLYKLKKQQHPMIQVNQDNLLLSLLEFAKQEKLLVTLEMEDDSVIGYVEYCYDDYIVLNVVDFYGKNKGKSVININELTVIACDGDDEQDLKLLNLLYE